MASQVDEVFNFASIVHGHHVYNIAWTQFRVKILSATMAAAIPSPSQCIFALAAVVAMPLTIKYSDCCLWPHLTHAVWSTCSTVCVYKCDALANDTILFHVRLPVLIVYSITHTVYTNRPLAHKAYKDFQ